MERGLRAVVLGIEELDALLRAVGDGRRVLGPVLVDGVIGIGEVRGVADLPAGWTDEQAPGRYRVRRRDDGALFGYAVGDRSWRREVDPPSTVLVRIRRTDEDPYEVLPADPLDAVVPTAWVGVRGCDLAALRTTDRIFLGGDHPDPHYAARRHEPLVVAVECGAPAAGCFCTSRGTGPAVPVDAGADLVLTEVCDEAGHAFVCRATSERGLPVLDALAAELGRDLPAAGDADLAAATAVTVRAVEAMVQHLPSEGLRERLAGGLEDPRWDEVAARCLSCGNCTLVCPTCFCSAVEDRTDLSGTEATRTRVWDSCFTEGHSYLHGGPVRATTAARYRQWLTHKLDTWWDQFDTSGCVGCGRCTTWCPAGIDLVAEAAAIGAAEAVR